MSEVKVINQINGKDIGGDAGDGSGMTINEIVNTIYSLSQDLQCPVYFGDGPSDLHTLPAGALRVKIS